MMKNSRKTSRAEEAVLTYREAQRHRTIAAQHVRKGEPAYANQQLIEADRLHNKAACLQQPENPPAIGGAGEVLPTDEDMEPIVAGMLRDT